MIKSIVATPFNFIASLALTMTVILGCVYLISDARTAVMISDTTADAAGVGFGAFIGGIPEFFAGMSEVVGDSEVAGKGGAQAAKGDPQ